MARTLRNKKKEREKNQNASTDRRRNILLCVAGYTPQIITETLWALTQEQGLPINEIRVITTLDGEGIIKSSLWNNGTGKFYEFISDYPKCSNIKFDNHSLYLLTKNKNRMPSEFDLKEDRLKDVVSSADNECAANQICEIVRTLTLENTRIHATVAGGRKTMSIYLTVAMQLFGRAEDTLSHVLVRKDLESRDFYYPKPQPRKRASVKTQGINLGFIPYIRLRGIGQELLREGGLGYSKYVEEVQQALNWMESEEEVTLCLKDKTVSVGKRTAKLSAKQFFVYLVFALQRQQYCDEGFLSHDDIAMPHFNEAFRLFSKAKGREMKYSEFKEKLRDESDQAGMDTDLVAVKDAIETLLKTKSSDKKKYVNNLNSTITRINNDGLKKKNITPQYHIVNISSDYADARYGLNLSPERIIII